MTVESAIILLCAFLWFCLPLYMLRVNNRRELPEEYQDYFHKRIFGPFDEE
jgi:hypothetical protein